MEESTTYQLLIERGEAIGEARGEARGKAQGRQEEAQELLLRIGRKRFGEPDANTQATLAVASRETLEQMMDRLLEVETWQELIS